MKKLLLLFFIFISLRIFAQPCGLTLVVLSTFTAPCGECNCAIQVDGIGGTGPLSFVWNNLQTSDSIYGICPGTYVCTVTDTMNCTSTGTITITSPAPPTVSVTANPASCDSCCDAFATATVAGGSPPYSYLWSDNTTSATDTGLCVSKVLCCVTDANGCTTCDTVDVYSLTGIISPHLKENIIVYQDHLSGAISFSERTDVTLSDMEGRIVMASSETDRINVCALPKGIYLLQLSKGNSILLIRKIVL